MFHVESVADLQLGSLGAVRIFFEVHGGFYYKSSADLALSGYDAMFMMPCLPRLFWPVPVRGSEYHLI